MKKSIVKFVALSTACFVSIVSAQSTEKLEQVLTQVHVCSPTITIRSQSLLSEQIETACTMLSKQETKFHALFNTQGKPVANDNNTSMRANIYSDRAAYVKHVTAHFDVPSDNGGMYLEGLPHLTNNHAEFVAYEKDGQIWNLSHEYVHYLDGRFNTYGDFCASLHDNHSAPEYCPQPSPLYPHLVWWGEGIAEYVARGDFVPDVLTSEVSSQKKKINYVLSELFNTSYEHNGGGDRVYKWGYLAVRFMMEKHRSEIDHMLSLTRKGYYAQYQALAKLWGTRFDDEFTTWLVELKAK